MALVSRCGVALLLAGSISTCSAFAPSPKSKTHTVSYSNSALQAMPPMIIGPMIKRMREEKEKAKMPMASADESKNEAPGLRVGENAWKWPPVWPYDRNFFKRKSELEAAKAASSPLNMMTGQIGTPNGGDVAEGTVFDSLGYWEKVSDVKTELDPRNAEKIKK
jgi:hypothetical protein